MAAQCSHPPARGHHTITPVSPTGLPRRLVVNAVIPIDAPSLMGSPVDGNCYQVVIVYSATAESLAAWRAAGSAASRLFSKFAAEAPTGVLPPGGNLDIKERLKMVMMLDNMADLKLGSMIEKWAPLVISH